MDLWKEEMLSLAVELVKDHDETLSQPPQDGFQLQQGHANRTFKTDDSKDAQTGYLSDAIPRSRDNWTQVAAHSETTDLRYLETLRISIPTEQWFGPSYDYCQLLQRCRALKNLDILPLGQSSFAWAVQEKRDHEGRIIANEGQGVVAWEEDPLPHSLVPLKNFTIEEQLKPLTDEVDDVAFAFSQTLATITVTTSGTDTEMRWIQLGQGWAVLPMLTRLEIQANFARLDFHSELLSCCPNVTCGRLSKRMYGYRCQDIVPCQVVHLAHVETLDLTGWCDCPYLPPGDSSFDKQADQAGSGAGIGRRGWVLYSTTRRAEMVLWNRRRQSSGRRVPGTPHDLATLMEVGLVSSLPGGFAAGL